MISPLLGNGTKELATPTEEVLSHTTVFSDVYLIDLVSHGTLW